MTEWQPIESAPKDGTEILACVNGFVPAVAWWEELPDDIMEHISEREKWRSVEAAEFETEEQWMEHWTGSWYEPTHWMPLPEPPELSDES